MIVTVWDGLFHQVKEVGFYRGECSVDVIVKVEWALGREGT
jgi:hypothetical protein